jgi:hypothetical protein
MTPIQGYVSSGLFAAVSSLAARVPGGGNIYVGSLSFVMKCPFLRGSSRFTIKEYSPQRRTSSHGSAVREASRQASSTAFSSEPVEESP